MLQPCGGQANGRVHAHPAVSYWITVGGQTSSCTILIAPQGHSVAQIPHPLQ